MADKTKQVVVRTESRVFLNSATEIRSWPVAGVSFFLGAMMVGVVREVVEDRMTGGCLGSEGAAAWTGRSA